mmetsp:Transcript_81337/g.263877  ORF Transcript_81337/g.263877 Transcript_81337/m.263877 type:complete len:304 (-) Transcript_81337:791-1702(-)
MQAPSSKKDSAGRNLRVHPVEAALDAPHEPQAPSANMQAPSSKQVSASRNLRVHPVEAALDAPHEPQAPSANMQAPSSQKDSNSRNLRVHPIEAALDAPPPLLPGQGQLPQTPHPEHPAQQQDLCTSVGREPREKMDGSSLPFLVCPEQLPHAQRGAEQIDSASLQQERSVRQAFDALPPQPHPPRPQHGDQHQVLRGGSKRQQSSDIHFVQDTQIPDLIGGVKRLLPSLGHHRPEGPRRLARDVVRLRGRGQGAAPNGEDMNGEKGHPLDAQRFQRGVDADTTSVPADDLPPKPEGDLQLRP